MSARPRQTPACVGGDADRRGRHAAGLLPRTRRRARAHRVEAGDRFGAGCAGSGLRPRSSGRPTSCGGRRRHRARGSLGVLRPRDRRSAPGPLSGANLFWSDAARIGAAHVPVLLDPLGEVGRTYGAKNTPQMFIVDDEGILVFAGGVDNAPLGRADGEVRNFVDEALTALDRGGAARSRGDARAQRLQRQVRGLSGLRSLYTALTPPPSPDAKLGYRLGRAPRVTPGDSERSPLQTPAEVSIRT